MIRFAACAALVVAAGCSGGGGGGGGGGGEPPSKAGAGAASIQDGTCPVTLPNGSVPPNATNWVGNDPENSHGNGKLWTLLWPYNVVIAGPDQVEDDGSVRMKWPWWLGVKGELRIEGRRLDREAPPLRAEAPPGYGASGFQPSGIVFPTEGCWEVTGSVGDASLTFVTLVLGGSRYSR